MAKKHTEQSPDAGLIETVANSDLRDVAKDATELVVDSFLIDGVLKEIPIVRSVVGLAKAGMSIRDRLFVEKVLRFLSPIGEYTADQRRDYLNSLDAQELKSASQHLILYLDRLDSIEKASMLGKVFQAYMIGKITYRQMLYFTHFIDSVFILVWQEYFEVIKRYHDHTGGVPLIDRDNALALEKVGFYKEQLKTEEGLDIQGSRYTKFLTGVKRTLELTDAGWDFIRIIFELWSNDQKGSMRYWLNVDLTAR